MSQQRPARRLPSLLVDPAEETVRRRCRDPINVDSLLPSKIRINLEDNAQGSDLNSFTAVPQQKKLQQELSDLSAMEDALDELIKDCAQQLFELTDDKENEKLAYVTYQDIHSIRAFHEQIIIAVKAPEETRLDVPAPREDAITVHIRSTKGPIDVYLCEVEQSHSAKSAHPMHSQKEESPQSEEMLEMSN